MKQRLRFHWCAQRANHSGGYQLSDGYMTLVCDPFSPELPDAVSDNIAKLKGWENESWCVTSLTLIASEDA